MLLVTVVSRVYSQRHVSAANFVMHEVHCARNITCCPQCKEPVPRSSLEEHIEENHKLVNCKQCYKEMECCLLEEHMVSNHICYHRYCISLCILLVRVSNSLRRCQVLLITCVYIMKLTSFCGSPCIANINSFGYFLNFF